MSISTARPNRNRVMLVVGISLAIALGLASRKYKWLVPASMETLPGDALWAIVLFQCIALVKPATCLRTLAFATLAISFLVEFSQLYQAPWIRAIRKTMPGHLLLGADFDRLDLLAYVAGVAICCCLVQLNRRLQNVGIEIKP